MYKSSTKPPFLPFMISVALAALPLVSSGQATPASCKALAQVGNNLWFVQGDGVPITQLTNDQQLRTAAALSANGKVVAYSGKAPPNDVSLIDANGRLISNLNVDSQSAIVGLSWIDPSILRVEEHRGPNVSKYHFVDLSNANAPEPIPAVGAEGNSCATSRGGKDTACLSADAVSLNGRDIYYLTDAFKSAVTLQTVDIAAGSSVTTATSPAFRVDIKTVNSQSKTVAVRVTSPDGLWQEEYVPAGEMMSVTFEDKTSSLAEYGFRPVLTGSGLVRLEVKKSSTGRTAFAGDIAWDPRGKRIAVVESNRAGQHTLVLLSREMGRAAIQGKGGVDAHVTIPIDGPIQSIKFVSDTRIRIEGATKVAEMDISAQGNVAGSSFTVTPSMPRKLMVNVGGVTTTALVKGWICPQ